MGEMLREFLLAEAADMEAVVEDDRTGRRRALVDGENVSGHAVPFWMLVFAMAEGRG